MRVFIVILSALLVSEIFLTKLSCDAGASPCESGEYETGISGSTECLLMRRYGSLEPKTLIIVLHGNASTGGPVVSHFKMAENAASDFQSDKVLVVALVRPGYYDDTGAYSSSSDNGRADNWQRPTVLEIGSVIENLKIKFKPETTILVGHSGGAAISAVLMGIRPDLADSAILIGCPCDMVEWRRGRSRAPWASEDPLKWVSQVKQTARIIALTGSQDDTTAPGLSKTYIGKLQERGIKAEFRLVPEMGHIDVLKSDEITNAIAELLR